MSTSTLSFMGEGAPEIFRCRVYGGDLDDAADETERRAFVEQLAGEGVIDCPAIDPWIAALQGRGWLPAGPELERNPHGPGRIGRWRLTPQGRQEWDRIRAG